jgi:hypothetical protein
LWEQSLLLTEELVAERIAEARGFKHAEVVTAGLVQDERGWLRLAG